MPNNDNDVVHKSLDEEIGGEKTFKNRHNYSSTGINDLSSIDLRMQGFTRGTIPSTTRHAGLLIFDDSNSKIDNKGRLGAIHTSVSPTTGAIETCIHTHNNALFDPDDTSTYQVFSTIGVGFDENNERYARAPSTSETRTSGGDILTRDWIPKDTRILHTSNVNEEFSGLKMSKYIFGCRGTHPNYLFVIDDVKKGTNPTGTRWAHCCVAEGGTTTLDDNKNMIMNFGGGIWSSGTTGFVVTVWKNIANDTSSYCTFNFTHEANDSWLCRPGTTNLVSLGSTNYRWKEVWANASAINSSDERIKSSIESFPDAVLDAWGEVDFCQFKFNDAVEEKGEDNARIHGGLIAQKIDRIFKKHNLDVSKYGLFCYDEWDAVPEERNEHDQVIQRAEPAGSMYSIRYTEALCMEAAYQRRRASRAEERISLLEQRLNSLEEKLVGKD